MRAVKASGPAFWQAIEKTTLINVGFKEDNVAEMQHEFLAQKMTAEGEKAKDEILASVCAELSSSGFLFRSERRLAWPSPSPQPLTSTPSLTPKAAPQPGPDPNLDAEPDP